jgi:hypothetical protein
VDNRIHYRDTEFTEMRHLLEDITSSVTGREDPAENDDGLTSEEKTQLRELCILIVISEFLEGDSETDYSQQGRKGHKDNIHHEDTKDAK